MRRVAGAGVPAVLLHRVTLLLLAATSWERRCAGHLRVRGAADRLHMACYVDRTGSDSDRLVLASTFDGGAAVQVCASEVCGSDLCLMMNWSAVRLTAEGRRKARGKAEGDRGEEEIERMMGRGEGEEGSMQT